MDRNGRRGSIDEDKGVGRIPAGARRMEAMNNIYYVVTDFQGTLHIQQLAS